MDALRIQLGVARSYMDRAEDEVDRLSIEREALGSIVQETRENLDTLSELYELSGSRHLEDEYLDLRNLYRRMREEHLGICARLRRAERELELAEDEEREALREIEREKVRREYRRDGYRPEYERWGGSYTTEERRPGYEGRSRRSYGTEERRPDYERSRRSYTTEERRPEFERSRGSYTTEDRSHANRHDSSRRYSEERRDRYDQDEGYRSSSSSDRRRQEKPRHHEEKPRQEKKEEPRSTCESQPQKQKPGHRPPPSDKLVTDWWNIVNVCFKDYSQIKQFPTPPICTACSDKCESSLKALLKRVPNLNLKKERIRWHPDRFSTCQEAKKDDFKKKAEEVFVVLDAMLTEEKEKN